MPTPTDTDTTEPQPSRSPDTTPVLSLTHASKAFAGVHALQDVSLQLYPGEVHALVGENGAGKSTLVKILGGVYQPDVGLLTVDGEEVYLNGPADAADRGIAVIYQEPTLFPDLSVAENVFIGRQPMRRGRRIDLRAMNREVEEIFTRLGVPIDPERIARGLSIAEQQRVLGEVGHQAELDLRRPVPGRGAAPVRRRRDAAGPGRRDRVHLPSPGGGVRALPAGDRPARRAADHVALARGSDSR